MVAGRGSGGQRIALYIPSLRGGGAERVMLNLANGFAARGVAVDLVLARAEGPFLSQVASGVRVIDLDAPRVLRSLPGLVRYLRRERPKALLSAMDHANVIAIAACRLAGARLRLVVSVHSPPSIPARGSGPLRRRLLLLTGRAYRGADAVVAVSKGVARDLIGATGLPPSRVHVIYNPVVTAELYKKAQEPVDHPWFREGQPPVILSAGRLTKEKDFSTLLRAFALLRKEGPGRLVILGEGEERPHLERLAERLGIGADVAFPGFVDNPYAYMKHAAVFALSSAWEGFGNVLVEALAVGTPVVATDCPGGPGEILENGRWGRLVPPGSPEQLAEAMLAALRDPGPVATPVRAKAFAAERILEAYAGVLGVIEEGSVKSRFSEWCRET